ncbi:peptidase M15 [Prolixibacteraceae bacterium JC049]|nr:peptidase M15 [Prolixibacteraceae bacterium JC049]
MGFFRTELFNQVIRSEKAEQLDIDNSKMSLATSLNIRSLIRNVLVPVREKFENTQITSGYRSPKLNSVIGGVAVSQHIKGEALDLVNAKRSNKELFLFIKENLKFDQLIWEFGDDKNPEWVHVSYKRNGNNRNMILRSAKLNNKTCYTTWKG